MWTRLTLVALLLCVLVAPTASADHIMPGAAGIFFDQSGTTLSKIIAGFAVDFFYVMGYGLGDITGWEASVNWSDPSWNVLGTTLNPGTALNVGSVGNFIVGLGACVDGGAAFYTLVTYQIGYFVSPVAPSDVVVCLGAASPSSFGSAPGYSNCADELVPFAPIDFYCSGVAMTSCGVINPTCYILPTASSSFGALKARF